MVSLAPWKVHLFCQFCLVPLLAFMIVMAFPSPSECKQSERLCRVSLFLLSTCPQSPWIPWFVKSFEGDFQESLIAIVLCHLTFPIVNILITKNVGHVISPDLERMGFPITEYLVFVQAFIWPTVTGATLRYTFPKLGVLIDKYSGYLVVFLHLVMVLVDFCHDSEANNCSKRQITLVFVIKFAGSFLSCTLAVASRFSRESIISITVTVGAQNHLLHWILFSSFAPGQKNFGIIISKTQNVSINLPLCFVYSMYAVYKVAIKYDRPKIPEKVWQIKGKLKEVSDPKGYIIKEKKEGRFKVSKANLDSENAEIHKKFVSFQVSNGEAVTDHQFCIGLDDEIWNRNNDLVGLWHQTLY